MKKLFEINGEGDSAPLTLRAAIQEHYTAVAERGASCCASGECGGPSFGASDALYSAAELAQVTEEAAGAAAGCGNPVSLAEIRSGETVLDLGSGGGIDCFLAARAVGKRGRVVGVDMTPAMVDLARRNAAHLGADNVVFKLAPIEAIPEPDSTVDVIISNCVIALAPDKDAVFREAFRVLRPGGRLMVSDMVTDAPLPEEAAADPRQWAACIGGADLRQAYLARIEGVGFGDVEVVSEAPMAGDRGEPNSERRSAVHSITVRAVRPADARF